MELIAKNIFNASVNAVKPKNLFTNLLTRKVLYDGREILTIQGNTKLDSLEIDITEKQCHLVGFGKGVFGMGIQIEKALNSKLVSGILSVPIGIQDRFRDDIEMQFAHESVIEVYEGAENNLPDQSAQDTAKRIRRLVKNLKENDILFVVISGGGSALLPLPTSPINLNEKLDVIRNLAKTGANIEELNIVRIAMSELKGGKLAEIGENCNKIISFIISDIINDPLELIASGPTIQNKIKSNEAYDILVKYNLWNDLPKSVKPVIIKHQNARRININNSEIFLIGSNEIAIKSAEQEALSHQLDPIILSHSIQGDVTEITKSYINLTLAVKEFLNHEITNSEFKSQILQLQSSLNFNKEFINSLEVLIKNNSTNPICILAGGEPTVHVKGSGIGGRNQELALRFALLASKSEKLKDVLLLSAGTDGIDGPTTAAGAIGCPGILNNSKFDDAISESLNNSDSFNFLKNFNDGKYHVVTGHTGTNVMDIHVLIIPRFLNCIYKL